MKYFSLIENKEVTNIYLDRPNTRIWVYAGVYPIVREFDKDRWLINVGNSLSGKDRLLTVIAKDLGEITNVAI
jgi:hypothetical protein